MSITWRGVRSWGTGSSREGALALTARPVADERRRRCGASGWRLRDACTDGHGGAICPLCGQSVRAQPDVTVGRAVRVLQDHGT